MSRCSFAIHRLTSARAFQARAFLWQIRDWGNMADQIWTVKDLTDALKRFPLDAKVYYEMGPNGPGTISKAQYVKAWGGSEEMAVLLDR